MAKEGSSGRTSGCLGLGRALVTAVVAVNAALGAACSGAGDDAIPPTTAGASDTPSETAELASCEVQPEGAHRDRPAGDRSGSPVVEPVEVTVWYAEDEAFSRPFVELVDEFATTRPEIEVHLDDLGSRGRSGVLDVW